jgi:hypothetical protein
MNAPTYVWTVGDHQYILVPEIRQSPRKIWLLGAGMYSLSGEYVGYWARRQMPLRLIRDLTAYWKHYHEGNRYGTRSLDVARRGRKTRKGF